MITFRVRVQKGIKDVTIKLKTWLIINCVKLNDVKCHLLLSPSIKLSGHHAKVGHEMIKLDTFEILLEVKLDEK